MGTGFHDLLHGLRFEGLREDVVRRARRWLLDLAGIAAAGATLPLSRLIREDVAAQFGVGARGARMPFDGRAVSPAGAALAGGTTIDALDGHNGHKLPQGHVGCGAFPAAPGLQADGRIRALKAMWQ